METNHDASLQWLDARDERFNWLNVADWEARGNGWQPVRVPKVWRDKWPAKTARRGMSAAGMALRFRTDSEKLLLRVTFVDAPDTPTAGKGLGQTSFRSTATAGFTVRPFRISRRRASYR
jgi:hypothetical protein